MSQLILFDDSGVVQEIHDVDDSYVSDGNNVSWAGGTSFMSGINLNFGLFPAGTANVGEILSPAQYMPVIQAFKISELDKACTDCIYGGFDCKPLGDSTVYHFPFDHQAQSNYNQYLTDVLFGDATDFGWKVRDQNGNWMSLTITPDQFKINIRPVATNFKMAQITQYRNLSGEVMNAQDIKTVKAIVWSAATY